MKAKLTLSLDPEIIKFAHLESKRQNRSVSEMVERHFYQRKVQAAKKHVTSFRDAAGSLAKYQIDDSKESIRDMYAEKYLR